MEFNIQNFIKKIKVNNQDFVDKQDLLLILKKYIPNLIIKNFILNKGVITFRDISPLKRSHIKRFKIEIIKKASEKEIIVRDII